MTATSRVALFIDAENASAKNAQRILNVCAGLGRLCQARSYGNAAALKSWEKAAMEHFITPVLTPPWADKPNASDFSLVIAAVADTLQGHFDQMVLATSDADFAQLAIFIRAQGLIVHGVGDVKAPAALLSALDEFHMIGSPANKKTAPSPNKPPTMPRQKPPPIDSEFVLGIYNQLASGGHPVDMQAFARELAGKSKAYKKGYRTVEKYLDATGLFKHDRKIVQLK